MKIQALPLSFWDKRCQVTLITVLCPNRLRWRKMTKGKTKSFKSRLSMLKYRFYQQGCYFITFTNFWNVFQQFSSRTSLVASSFVTKYLPPKVIKMRSQHSPLLLSLYGAYELMIKYLTNPAAHSFGKKCTIKTLPSSKKLHQSTTNCNSQQKADRIF